MNRKPELQKLKIAHILLLLLLAATVTCAEGLCATVEKPGHSEEPLLKTYQKNLGRLESSSFGLPLFLESVEQDDAVHVDVYGMFNYPFSTVVNALTVPANWCDIVSLHPNIKACTYRELADSWRLALYIGRKEFQAPEDTHQILYRYRNVDQKPGYLDIVLTAGDGPFGTRDHKMRFEALPIGEGKTFVHVSYTYIDNVALRLASKVYFATLGRTKAGFTVTGTDSSGNPVHIGGPRGSIERNAVRYYFAIQAFMHTSKHPEQIRFNISVNEWYDLTAPYKKQLFDLEKKEYLRFKKQEHKNQLLLQQQIETVHN